MERPVYDASGLSLKCISRFMHVGAGHESYGAHRRLKGSTSRHLSRTIVGNAAAGIEKSLAWCEALFTGCLRASTQYLRTESYPEGLIRANRIHSKRTMAHDRTK